MALSESSGAVVADIDEVELARSFCRGPTEKAESAAGHNNKERCFCCGSTEEEFSAGHVAQVREKYLGHFIWGICETVVEWMMKERNIAADETIRNVKLVYDDLFRGGGQGQGGGEEFAVLEIGEAYGADAGVAEKDMVGFRS